jgi:hypothetical protein
VTFLTEARITEALRTVLRIIHDLCMVFYGSLGSAGTTTDPLVIRCIMDARIMPYTTY